MTPSPDMARKLSPQQLLKGIPDVIFLLDNNARIICANPAALRLLKTDENRLRDKSLMDISGNNAEQIQKSIRRWSRSGQPMPAFLNINTTDGDTIACQAWGHMIEKDTDEQSGIILLRLKQTSESNKGFATLNNKIAQLKKEINDRLQIEKALRQSQDEIILINEDLEQRVEHRTRELQKTNEQLQQSFEQIQQAQVQLVEAEKMASLGNLVAGVAHEINTPIGVSVTATSFLQTNVEQYNKLFKNGKLTRSDYETFMSEAVESTDIILGNLRRAAELIQSFKQVAVDQSTDEKRQFNMKQYLEELMQSLKPKLKKTAINVNIDVPNDMTINSTPGAFSQIFTNLIMNSLIHAFEPSEQGEISIAMQYYNGDRVQLCYKDDGKGIPRENLKKIFEPFFSTNRHGGGTGLGMHIVYNLITQKLGGNIRCQSEPGSGTEFEIIFPINTD